MARSGQPRRTAGRGTLGRLFADDPLAAVVAVLRDAGPGTGLSAAQVKAALRDGGVPEDGLRSWRRVQAKLVAHDRIVVTGDRYRRTYGYLPEPPRPEPAEALALLERHRLPAARRAQLAETVRTGLAGAVRSTHAGGGPDARVARLEQREKEAVRALAELAIEIEEMAVNEASSRAIVHTVRALTKLAELVPLERAGELTRFDSTRHTSVAGRIADGAPVLVLRPGYLWNRHDAQILIARPVVQDRSPET